MIDLNPDGGGVLITGRSSELYAFAEAVTHAADHGEAVGHILTAEGVENVTVRLEVVDGLGPEA